MHFFTHSLPSIRIMADLLRVRRAPAEIMEMICRQDQEAAEQEAKRKRELRWKTADRNAPCPCGSGKKYKKCCLGRR